MIVPKLYGRLGNQCFQIAAAIAHARKMNTQWGIPRYTQDLRYWPNYFLHRPNIRPTGISYHPVYNEPRHCYDQLPAQQNLTINGYFQSEKYWPSYEEKYEIGNALGFHSHAYEYESEGRGYIAVHVRRGDYVTQFPDKHPALDINYYEQATEYFLRHGHDNFRVYSDDIVWCKREFESNMLWKFTYSAIKDPLTDMRDMYNASGFIIANSTFSLFPALLRLDNPVVIAPKEERWFGPGNAHLETCDLLPERFIKI